MTNDLKKILSLYQCMERYSLCEKAPCESRIPYLHSATTDWLADLANQGRSYVTVVGLSDCLSLGTFAGEQIIAAKREYK